MAQPEKFDMLKMMMRGPGAARGGTGGGGEGGGADADMELVPMLVRTLSAQKELYIQLLDLAKQQSQHVLAGETESLMTVLAARSRLIDRVAPLDKQLQPYKGKWQEVLDGLAANDRSAVAGLLKEVQRLLSDILAQDERDKESLTRQKSEIGAELHRTVTGAALHRAYGAKPRVGSLIG